MCGSIEIDEVMENMARNGIFTSNYITYIIYYLSDFIISSSIDGGSMKEASAGITISEPSYSRFSLLGVFFTL